MENMVTFSAAIDDPTDTHGWNPTTSVFGARNSLGADIFNRLLSILSDTTGKGSDALSIMHINQSNEGWLNANDVYISFIWVDPSPTADILSWDSDTDQGLVLTTTSNTGITAQTAAGIATVKK